MNISAIGVKPYSNQNRNQSKNQNVAFGANFTEGLELVTKKGFFSLGKFRKQVQALIGRPDNIGVKVKRSEYAPVYDVIFETESGKSVSEGLKFSELKKTIVRVLQPKEKDGAKVYKGLDAEIEKDVANKKFTEGFGSVLKCFYFKDDEFLAQLEQVKKRLGDGFKVSAYSLRKDLIQLGIETKLGHLTRNVAPGEDFKTLVLNLLQPAEKDGKKVRESIEALVREDNAVKMAKEVAEKAKRATEEAEARGRYSRIDELCQGQ